MITCQMFNQIIKSVFHYIDLKFFNEKAFGFFVYKKNLISFKIDNLHSLIDGRNIPKALCTTALYINFKLQNKPKYEQKSQNIIIFEVSMTF